MMIRGYKEQFWVYSHKIRYQIRFFDIDRKGL